MVKSRPAVVGEELVVYNFGTGTRGFAAAGDAAPYCDTAVCLLPGTELKFSEPVRSYPTAAVMAGDVATFRQVNREQKHAHHDALEFVDGRVLLLTLLTEGQRATVLQLPPQPTNEAEREEQRRVEFVG
jgi:hypothetical protein